MKESERIETLIGINRKLMLHEQRRNLRRIILGLAVLAMLVWMLTRWMV